MFDLKSNTIVNGLYVIFQKKDYKKLHLLSEKTDCIFIGKDQIEVQNVLGEKIGSTFKLVSKSGRNRQFTLQLCTVNDTFSTKESLKDLVSGCDNRGIQDDGLSQVLTKDSIEELRDSGITPQAILGQLIENSKTFQEKTEYSQEKYIEKKEKKYFDFITVRHPTIRLLADMFYNRDLPKSVGIRIDTLSQLASSLNFQSSGSYVLVESGYRGIVAATLLNLLSDKGRLVHITPEVQNQKQAILAMNFSSARLSQLSTIRLSTMTELMEKNVLKDEGNSHTIYNGRNCAVPEAEDSIMPIAEDPNCEKDFDSKSVELKINTDSVDARKRKITHLDSTGEMKKPRWMTEAELAIEILSQNVDGVVVACKEFPGSILNKLLEYTMPSRPFVVYSLYQEPLVSLYVDLKKRQDIVCLRITETMFRPYQILPDRSHPVVTVSSSSGYLLSGIKVAK